MKLLSGKRIGQSGYELTLAVFFSFFIHAAVVVVALFLYMAASPKVYVPPSYNVKLVGLPEETVPAPDQQKAPLPPARAEKKAEPKAKQVARTAPKKAAMPELSLRKQKQAKRETEAQESPSTSIPGAESAKTNVKNAGVNVPISSEDFKFPTYLATIRLSIEQNWNPPPGIKGTKAKVQFRVLRSGRVADAVLQESSGNFYFDQAAVRAILQSSPFPEMPDGFYKDHEDFSVDLMEKE
jgi:colicin import membrane protein